MLYEVITSVWLVVSWINVLLSSQVLWLVSRQLVIINFGSREACGLWHFEQENVWKFACALCAVSVVLVLKVSCAVPEAIVELRVEDVLIVVFQANVWNAVLRPDVVPVTVVFQVCGRHS